MQGGLFKAFEQESELGRRFLEIIERSVHRIGIKEFTFLIQKKEPAQIRDALNGNGKYFSTTWLPVLLRRDPEFATEFINIQCDITGKEYPCDKRELTPEEELRLLKERISQHGLQSLFKGSGVKI